MQLKYYRIKEEKRANGAGVEAAVEEEVDRSARRAQLRLVPSRK